MANPIQSQYGRYQQAGYPGEVARPSDPCVFDIGQAHIPASGDNLQPGWGVYWDSTNDGFIIPAATGNEHNVTHIVSFDRAHVASTLSAIPTGANSDQLIEFADGAVMKLGAMGHFWVIARVALEFGDHLNFDFTTKKWETYTPAASDIRTPAICVSQAPVAANGLAIVRFGFGRL